MRSPPHPHEARMASVPIVESRPLARALYATCRVDEEIPRELFEGVATVLAFVHRLKLRPSVSGEHLLEVPVSPGTRAVRCRAANRIHRQLRGPKAAGSWPLRTAERDLLRSLISAVAAPNTWRINETTRQDGGIRPARTPGDRQREL
jgi:hypothetical protein